MDVLKILMDGINACMGWFWDLMTKSDTWAFYLTSFIIVCLGSLLIPFIGYRVRVGSSDTARRFSERETFREVRTQSGETWYQSMGKTYTRRR